MRGSRPLRRCGSYFRETVEFGGKERPARARPVVAQDGKDGSGARKLPCPTRSLPPCGSRSLLEGGAFPHRNCAPRPRAWARPGFLLPFHGGGGGSEQCCDPRLPDLCRELSRRFNSRCPRALSPSEERELNPFAVVVPECRVRGRTASHHRSQFTRGIYRPRRVRGQIGRASCRERC